jgi:hypothetical protein
MHSRIRASRPVQLHVLLREAPEDSNNFSLNCRFLGLNLPAMKFGAVIGDGELEMAHERDELGVQ